ncbi:hypothetical protein C7K25_12685 [Gulosibacter molinativorax]|uniref:DUF1049 domain-containing protein n=1 Tax=Gulosibacter molinativorax TaxID=256821 RepID=A0ABT7CAH5_9MICO|nr:hypothetical protein [Gulosibacter molinativorax]
MFVLDFILAALALVLNFVVPPNTDPESMNVLLIVVMATSVVSILLFVVAVALVLYGVAAHFEQQHDWNRRQTKLLEQSFRSATGQQGPATSQMTGAMPR